MVPQHPTGQIKGNIAFSLSYSGREEGTIFIVNTFVSLLVWLPRLYLNLFEKKQSWVNVKLSN